MRDDEVRRAYPCDEFVPRPVMTAWRGVTVHSTPDRVWSWVGQLRLAPYSYDWVDNLGRRSPRRLQGLLAPAVGEHFTTAFGRPSGRILAVTPDEALTAQIAGATMSYILVSEDDRVRLLLKVVTVGRPLIAPALCLGDLIMARRQLLNFKRLAEGR